MMHRERALGLWVGAFLSPVDSEPPPDVIAEVLVEGFPGSFRTGEYGSNELLGWLEDVWKGAGES